MVCGNSPNSYLIRGSYIVDRYDHWVGFQESVARLGSRVAPVWPLSWPPAWLRSWVPRSRISGPFGLPCGPRVAPSLPPSSLASSLSSSFSLYSSLSRSQKIMFGVYAPISCVYFIYLFPFRFCSIPIYLLLCLLNAIKHTSNQSKLNKDKMKSK